MAVTVRQQLDAARAEITQLREALQAQSNAYAQEMTRFQGENEALRLECATLAVDVQRQRALKWRARASTTTTGTP